MTSHARMHRESTHARTYLMCPPEYFTVKYAINPWMNPADPVDHHACETAVGAAARNL